MILFVLWPLFSPKNLYKAYESFNISYQEVKYSDNFLPGKHSLNCTFTKRNNNCKRYINFSITKSGISDKCQNVSSLTLSEYRVPGNLCRFKIIDLIPSTAKGSGNNKKSFSVRDLSANWENVLFSNSSSFSSPSLQIPSKTTGLRIFNRKELRKENLPQEVTEELQWWIPNIKLRNSKSLLTLKPQMLITSDALMKSWRVFCWRHKTAGSWSNLERREHTNVLQLKAAKIAIMKFTKMFQDVK